MFHVFTWWVDHRGQLRDFDRAALGSLAQAVARVGRLQAEGTCDGYLVIEGELRELPLAVVEERRLAHEETRQQAIKELFEDRDRREYARLKAKFEPGWHEPCL